MGVGAFNTPNHEEIRGVDWAMGCTLSVLERETPRWAMSTSISSPPYRYSTPTLRWGGGMTAASPSTASRTRWRRWTGRRRPRPRLRAPRGGVRLAPGQRAPHADDRGSAAVEHLWLTLITSSASSLTSLAAEPRLREWHSAPALDLGPRPRFLAVGGVAVALPPVQSSDQLAHLESKRQEL